MQSDMLPTCSMSIHGLGFSGQKQKGLPVTAIPTSSRYPKLFEPFELRPGIVLSNRVVMSPMCQGKAPDALATDEHLVFYGARARGGCGMIVCEATAVTPEGRIFSGDLGLWDDSQIAPLARVSRFIREQGCVAAIQIGHAGRKAFGTERFAPSPVPFKDGDPVPTALGAEQIAAVIASFSAAARRAAEAGFQVVELHAAHGFLLHQFLSPLSNRRTDTYGGAQENRMRIVREAARACRSALPECCSLIVRISATDWAEGGWELPDSIALCRDLKEDGVDLIDVSSGGTVLKPRVPDRPRPNIALSEKIRREAAVRTGAVGGIRIPETAEDILQQGQADLIFLGKALLDDPQWAEHAQSAL